MNSFKVALVGPKGVGKTSFVQALLNKPFVAERNSTLGVRVNPVKISERAPTLNIWDVGGDPLLAGDPAIYYNKANACIVMYDASKPESEQKLEEKINEFLRHRPGKRVYIVANKAEEVLWQVRPGILPCSAKLGVGHLEIANRIIDDHFPGLQVPVFR